MKTLLALLSLVSLLHAEEGFRPLFNGKDLADWDGNPELWSVEDGCITGKTKGPDHLAYNQFLIWRGGEVRNFELRAKIRVSASNSGIQYRSRENPDRKWSIRGYQCDIHPAAVNNAMVFEEGGRGIIVPNGLSAVLDPKGERWVVAQREPVETKIAEWHDYTIIARGNHLVHQIDGKVTAELTDCDEEKRSMKGLLAFQLHRGPAMVMQVKEVLIKELPEGKIVAFDRAKLPADAKPMQSNKKKEPAKGESKAASKPVAAEPAPANTPKDLKWIWSSSPEAKSGARLKTNFDLGTGKVTEAMLRVTCDNGAKVYLNGELALTNEDWQRPKRESVTTKLRAGMNELRAEATNKGSAAAFVGWLSVKFADGSERVVLTNDEWLAALTDTEDWKPAKVVASYGSRPWGDVLNGNRTPKNNSATQSTDVIQPADIKTLPGFKVEMIHKVEKDSEGSWVGMTVDDKGRLIATDQYGGLFRITPPPVGSGDKAQVEKLNAEIAGAHGLLYAFNSLYVLVNEKPNTPGLYRFRDTKGTGQFDEKMFLREIRGQGEHGNHSLALSPDGKSIYIACGNGTAQPQIEHTRGSRPFADDQIVPRTNKGAEFSDTEPHAFTCKVSPDGKRFEMIADGMRNHFDIAFNAFGDLFTFDSDMEWDAGTPWYRPTRIYHLISGADYGFRESSGKLLDYCEDIVPPLVDVGPGCPTGVVSGLGAAFPANYQNAIFACDWTYGTLYAVHLTPQGAGYTAKLEEFISGKPLPLTDAVIGKDGAMYFAIGGRRTQSALYRVTYEGKESTAPAPKPVETAEHKLRVELERLHEEGAGPEAIEKALPHLGHEDRLIRHAARVAIERQPVKLWADQLKAQRGHWAVIESAIALGRMGGKEHQAAVLTMLNALDFAALNTAQQLAAVRAYQITVARSGVPEGDLLTKTTVRLDALFPAKRNDLNRELSRTLVALGSEQVVAKTLRLMAKAKDDSIAWLSTERLARNDRYGPNFLRTGSARPNTQQIAYAYVLRVAKNGWTPELRREFFQWFGSTGPWIGGNQFRGFLDTMRNDALRNVTTDAAERKMLAELGTPKTFAIKPESIKPPKGPGKNYGIDEVVAFAKNGLKQRDFQRGRELFIAAACQACHRLGNEGGGVGPDLTGAANRYTLRDLLENIIDPSKVISDQYESTIIELKNGSTVMGRITGEEGGILQVATNPAAPGLITEVRNADIQSRKVSPVSLMPPGLINSMNETEVLDLLSYLLSGGDKKGPMFKN